jgi:hypothetical protein
VPLLGYPVVTLAGGGARFPSRSDCAQRAQAGGPVAVVYGRVDDVDAASALLQRVLAVGFTGTELQFDACGQWAVLLHNVPSIAVGEEIVREAGTVGLHPTLELDTGG